MIGAIKRIIDCSGKYKGRIKAAFIFSFLKTALQNAVIVLTVLMVDEFFKGTLVANSFVKYGFIINNGPSK